STEDLKNRLLINPIHVLNIAGSREGELGPSVYRFTLESLESVLHILNVTKPFGLSVRLAGWFQVIERAAGPTGTSFSLQGKALSGSLENPCLTESQLRLGSKYGDRSLGVRSL
ncbi:putative molybdenum carrier protein, partial [bacterium]|nr:putative molybdenum carrier protein [bacterium]